jgi:hypothetical protein
MTGREVDVNGAVAAVRARAEGPLYTLVQFDPDDFEVLYVSERTHDLYPEEGTLADHFEQIYDYVGSDFAERALFTDFLLAGAGDVTYMTTCLEGVKAVRAYDDDVTGVFLGVDPDEPVPPLVDGVDEHLL